MTASRRRTAVAAAGIAALIVALFAWARRTRVHPGIPEASVRESLTATADDGTRLYVEADGVPGPWPTVLFVHGFLARGAEFDAQWTHLRGRTRVLRFDHRGHGGSAAVRGRGRIEQLALDIAAVLTQCVPPGPVVVVAHSMGAMALMSLAVQRPDLFGSRIIGAAVLASSAGHDVDGQPVENGVRRLARSGLLTPLWWVMRLLAPVQERLRPRGTRAMRGAVRVLLFGSADATRDLVVQAQRMLEEPPLSTLAAFQSAVLQNHQLAAVPVLRQVPVTVVTGTDDRLIRPEHSRVLAEDIGDTAELVMLAGVGHALTQSAPVEVNAALDRLLDRAADYSLAKPSGSQRSPVVIT